MQLIQWFGVWLVVATPYWAAMAIIGAAAFGMALGVAVGIKAWHGPSTDFVEDYPSLFSETKGQRNYVRTYQS